MAEVRGVSALQSEIAKARENLKGVDEHIKKLTGRDPTERRQFPGPRRRVVSASGELRGNERIFNQARREIETYVPPVKRRVVGTAFSRLGPPRLAGRDRVKADSGDEEDMPNKPVVQSSVVNVIASKTPRSRKESIDGQSADRKGTARNKRMFGLLLGTLQKFKTEAKETEDRETHRKEIEKKLEEKFKQEKEEIIKERRQLFEERKHQQAKIQRLEQKMELVDMHEESEKEVKKLVNFLRTKAKPHIYYMPKIMNETLSSKLEDSKKAVEEMIKERKKRLEEEIERLMAEDIPDDHEHQSDEEEETKEKTDKENRENLRRRSHSGHKDRSSDPSPRKGLESSKRGSPRKGGDSSEGRRKSHEGESRRRDSHEGVRKRRKSSTDRHEGSSKYRRKSDGEGGHDRRSRRDSHRSRKDDVPREVKINYDDPEMEETEEVTTKGESEVKPPEPKKEDVKSTSVADIQLPESRTESDERKIVMAEDAEEGEEGMSMDAVDE
ncbi:pinin-like [Saccostrea echinata]|uniref:pinin-like n=1 Tax=Saccostrea echinata TaxID=191078 RepID=UPI002A8253C3|nr:pinin-like [Saccostrea echinata]